MGRHQALVAKLARTVAAHTREIPPELAPLAEKIQAHAYRITDEEIEALRASHDDDRLFEVSVRAALSAATTRLEAALAAAGRKP